MIPSRQCLKEDLERLFGKIASTGISNMKELVSVLKTREKIYTFAKKSGVPAEYLTLLVREARSYLPSPVRLDKLPGIPDEYSNSLDDIGIKNSRQLITEAGEKRKRAALARRTEIPLDVLDELVCLSDLARGYGIGPVFARLFYDVGIHTIQHFVGYSAEEIIKIYEAETGKKADFGVNEIQFSLELASELEIIVEV
jgi:hypothetical protein